MWWALRALHQECANSWFPKEVVRRVLAFSTKCTSYESRHLDYLHILTPSSIHLATTAVLPAKSRRTDAFNRPLRLLQDGSERNARGAAAQGRASTPRRT